VASSESAISISALAGETVRAALWDIGTPQSLHQHTVINEKYMYQGETR
jgi:hypothetical protein